MASCPETRERILVGINLTDGPIDGTIPQIKAAIGCEDISNSKFVRALNSLRYHHGLVTWGRKWNVDFGHRELANVSAVS